jgi:serine/threonine-protein kinase
MSGQDVNVFIRNLARSNLLTESEALELWKQARKESAAAAGSAEAFSAWLTQHGKLTPYQADSLLRGNTRFFLDEYKLTERIGTGRMAGVYRATHKLGMPVAVKILPPSKARGDTLARFEREAKLALQMDHPHIVKTYHAGNADGLNYIAMEYLEGETLEERLQEKGKLPPAEAVRIAYQALQGLQHIADKAMVHRDLKPGNLMLVKLPGTPGKDEPAYAVKLLDIGLGRALFSEDETEGEDANLTGTGELIGTPDYTAPEQSRDSHAADMRSDMYSLGCVVYHCLTGQVPFPDKNTVQKVMKHATQMPPAPDLAGYPHAAALQAWLWKMMAKKPADRFQNPAQAGQALEPLLKAKAAPAGPILVAQPVAPSAPPALPAPAQNLDVELVPASEGSGMKQWLLIGAAAVLMLAIALGAFFLIRKLNH